MCVMWCVCAGDVFVIQCVVFCGCVCDVVIQCVVFCGCVCDVFVWSHVVLYICV